MPNPIGPRHRISDPYRWYNKTIGLAPNISNAPRHLYSSSCGSKIEQDNPKLFQEEACGCGKWHHDPFRQKAYQHALQMPKDHLISTL
jgi:hypothetical protein